jgi:beta-glucosidase
MSNHSDEIFPVERRQRRRDGAGQWCASSTRRRRASGGRRAGDEVVQMDVQHVGSAVERPGRQPKGFRRITPKPDETRTARLALAGKDLAYWDANGRRWVIERDTVRILAGASSADIRLEHAIDVTGN